MAMGAGPKVKFFRKTTRLAFVIPWLILSVPLLTAQQPFSNHRTRLIDARQPLQQIDSLTIAAPLLVVFDSTTGEGVDLAFFSLENNLLRIDTTRLFAIKPTASRLYVNYRVLPIDLAAPIQRLDTAAIRRATSDNAIEFDYSPYEPPSKPWESSGLISNGAYTRGLSFGNNQNLAFNSNLNLQLSGRLGNDLEIQAALSDNSIPLQPDGTTRQLQEFDRIFVQIKRKNLSLTAGDYDLTRPASAGYFTNYFKRLQGAMVKYEVQGLKFEVQSSKFEVRGPDTTHQTSNFKLQTPNSELQTSNFELQTPNSELQTSNFKLQTPSLELRVAAAVSRGKFARQIVAGQEGNQGPYRLLGAEGERFIIVLAGTEKVYVDGQLLRRGLDDDYIIDYNLGEVTFTPRRLISKDSRVIIEFEYAVQTYLRSTLAANAEWQRSKSRFYFNAYSEQDSRNSGGAQDLSEAERSRLAQAGDDLQGAYASGIDTLDAEGGFDPSRVLYKSVDTVACGVLVPVLVYSANPDSARYAARFTEVPVGQGNYVQVQTAANGRVFRWVAPDSVSCQPGGNFEPVVRLIAPESRQLFAAGAEFQVSKATLVQAEVALSNRDLNRFSPLGNDDNNGLGGFLSLRQTLFPAGAAKGWNVQLNGTYEFAGRQFLPLNPYRPAEFIRDWNIGTAEKPATEHWARGGFSLQKTGWGSARYEFGAFLRESLYDGARHSAQARLQRNGFDLLAEVNLLETGGVAENTRFSRPKFDLGKTFFKKDKKPLFKIGFYGERERNERRVADADTLNRASFWYDLGRLYWQTPESQTWQLGVTWMHRNDFAPLGQIFKQNTAVDEANLTGRWAFSPKGPGGSGGGQSLAWNLSWRQLQVRDPELTTLDPQQTYLGRVDYTLSAWKNALAFTTGYELGSGQSPRVEFSYVRVNPGEGQYAWVDRNQDSILQVDEMEIAVFQDQAEYIRVAVTTTDYVRTNNATINQSLRLDPRLVWGQSKKRWPRLLSRLSTQSNLQITRRVLASARDEPAWNPFDLAVADTALLAVSATVRNALYINRADPAWDASLSRSDNNGRTALTTGFESRGLGEWILHGRANFNRQWSSELDLIRGDKTNNSQNFNARDYDILYWRAGPKLSWLPNRSFRLIASYAWRDSRNTLPSAETARQTDWSAEMTWNPPGKPNDAGFRAVTSIRTRATYSQIAFNGSNNSAVAYAMLDGLQDGRNFLWSLNIDRQLSRSVQLSLNYEGRKTGENRMVHVGRAQVRAIF